MVRKYSRFEILIFINYIVINMFELFLVFIIYVSM